jgi:protein-S-isoprenylcysteine O-methyltransferase Ste14
MDFLLNPETFDFNYWGMASLLILLGGVIVLSFVRPKRASEWRATGLFLVFVVSVFAGMYGLPFIHVEDHLFTLLAGLGIPVAMIVWLIGSFLILTGSYLVIRGWQLIRRGGGQLVTEDLYQHIRHPQYLGFIFITVGMLIQWPTLLVSAIWLILLITYYQLARQDDKILETLFGVYYHVYRTQTPMFFPIQKTTTSGIYISGDE